MPLDGPLPGTHVCGPARAPARGRAPCGVRAIKYAGARRAAFGPRPAARSVARSVAPSVHGRPPRGCTFRGVRYRFARGVATYSIYSQLGSARRVVTRVTRVSRHVCVVLESCGVTVRSVSGARLVRGDESAQREVTSVPMRVIFASSYCGILITIV